MSNLLTLGGPPKVDRSPLREQAVHQIKELILTNQLRPGQYLGIEELAGYLGVSHTPVREALAVLEREGLVLKPPYGKPQVTPVDGKDVHEVWEMRLLLEGAAIEKATTTLSDARLGEIERDLMSARADAEASDYRAHYESDVALHQAIVGCVENELFRELAQQVEDRSIRIRTLVEAVANEGDVVEIIDEHIELVRALTARDKDAARERLIAHLEAGQERTLAALDALRDNVE